MNERQEKEWQDLKMRLLTIGLRPEDVPAILDAMEGKRAEAAGEVPEFAPEISDEEWDALAENYSPQSVEDVQATIDALRRFGVAVS